MTAEAPAFIGQVFCFVKLKVVLDTLHIMVRSVIFIMLVMWNRDFAIYAFGIAQFSSALTIIIGNYLFFHYYIAKLREYRSELKRNDDRAVILKKFGTYYENMDDFPFTGVVDMIPGVLPNPVSTNFVINVLFLLIIFSVFVSLLLNL